MILILSNYGIPSRQRKLNYVSKYNKSPPFPYAEIKQKGFQSQRGEGDDKRASSWNFT